MDSTQTPKRVEFDEMSDGPPPIASTPEFHDILAGYIALADADQIETVPTEESRAKWALTKRKIKELREALRSMPQPK
jgi:hypothetical protein